MKFRSIVVAAALGVTGPILAAAPAEATPICAGVHAQVLSFDQSTGAICLPYPLVVHCEFLSTGVGAIVNVDLMACVPYV